MKTTIDLPDVLYRRAKIRNAAERGTTLRALLTESLEAYLLEPTRTRNRPQRDRFRTDEAGQFCGWPILQRSEGDFSRVITDDFIGTRQHASGRIYGHPGYPEEGV